MKRDHSQVACDGACIGGNADAAKAGATSKFIHSVNFPGEIAGEEYDEQTLMKYLLHVSSLTRRLSDLNLDDVKSQGPIKFINPYAHAYHHGDETHYWDVTDSPHDHVVDALQSSLWHMPLASVGLETANHSFCRVSFQYSDPDTLYIAFRPFILENLFDMVRKGFIIGPLVKLLHGTSPKPGEFCIDNLVHIIHCLRNHDIDPENPLITCGYREFLEQTPTKMTIENSYNDPELTSYCSDPKDKKEMKARMKRLSQDLGNPDVLHQTDVDSVVSALTTIVKAYAPKRLVCSGFSLGGGSSLASAVLIRESLVRQGAPVPKIHTVSFAGTMVGGDALQEYVSQHFSSVNYVMCEMDTPNGDGVIIDPVSLVPFSTNLRHVGQVHAINLASIEPKIRLMTEEFRGAETAGAWRHLVSSQFFGLAGTSDISRGFNDVHMISEDLLTRIFALYVLRNEIQTPLVHGIPCAFFTGVEWPPHLGVCPSEFCKLVKESGELKKASRVKRV